MLVPFNLRSHNLKSSDQLALFNRPDKLGSVGEQLLTVSREVAPYLARYVAVGRTHAFMFKRKIVRLAVQSAFNVS